jgi:hypothetical protein
MDFSSFPDHNEYVDKRLLNLFRALNGGEPEMSYRETFYDCPGCCVLLDACHEGPILLTWAGVVVLR